MLINNTEDKVGSRLYKVRVVKHQTTANARFN